MTDIGTVGFSTDTGSLVQLQDELDRLKAKVDSLNSSLKNMDPSSSAAKAKLAELKVATNDYQNAIGNLVDKQLASGKATQALETIVKNTGATYQQAAQAVKEVIAAHAQADSAVGKTAAALGAAGRAAAESGAEASRSGGFFSSLAAMLGLSASTADKHTIATHALAASHHSASEGAKVLREGMHTLIPALEEAGLKISLLTQYSGALRAGLPALGLAIAGGISVAVAKASDEADLARRRLEGLAGVKMGNEFAESLKKVSTELGTSHHAAAPAFEALSKIANLNTPPGGVRVIEPGQPELLKATSITADNLAKSYEAIFMQLRLGGAETAQATAAANKFFDELAKNGKVTSQMVDDLRKVAPQAATTLASAFTQGKLNVDQFIESLKKTPISLEKILELLPKIRDGGASAFRELQEKPITVAGAVDKLKDSFEKLWQTVDGGTKDRPGAIAQFIGQVAEDIESFNTAVTNAKAGTDDWNTNLGMLFGTVKMIASPFRQMGTDLADFVKGLSGSNAELGSSAGLFETLGHAVGVASSAIGSFASIVGGGLGDALGAIGNFVMASIQQLTDWANQAIGLANRVAAAIANATSNPGTPSAPQSVDAMGAVTGFATGGSFVVGGSGGTDSQLIQFMATPGERVSIDTPDTGGAAPKTLGSLIPSNDNTPAAQGDVMAARIAEDFTNQTAALSDKLGLIKDAIVAAIANVTSAVKAISIQTTAAAGAVPIATGTSSTSTGLGSPSTGAISAATGGGGATLGSIDAGSLKIPPAQPAAQTKQMTPAQAAAAALAAEGLAMGQGVPVKSTSSFGQNAPGTGVDPKTGMGVAPYSGPLDERGLPPAGMPGSPYAGPAAPLPGEPGSQFAGPVAPTPGDKVVADAVNSQTSDVKTIGDKTNQSLGSVEQSTKESLQSIDAVNQATLAGNNATQSGFSATNSSLAGVEGATSATTGAVESGSSGIVDSVTAAASQISNSVATAVTAGYGGGASAGGYTGGGVSSGGGGYSYSGGGASGFGYDGASSAATGSSVGGSGGTDSGGFTPSQAYFAQGMTPDYGAAVAGGTYPAMAIGGQFTIKGSGTTDTEHVEFMGTPGEVVTVTPPGGTPPSNPSMGGSAPSKGGMMAFATGGQFTLGDAMGGEPTLAGADIVAAHLADNTRDQTANLKDKLDSVADKIIEAIKAGSNMIRNAVTAALDKMAAEAKAAAAAATAARQATTSGGSGGISADRFGTGDRSLGGDPRAVMQSQLRPGYAIDPATGMPKQVVSYKNPVDQAGFANGNNMGGMNSSFVGPNGFGISPFAGMSEGGSFVVPGGAGGSDSVSVAIKASPGEKIIVLPPEKAKALNDLKNTIKVTPEPLSKFMPALQDNIPGGGSGAMSGSVIAGGAAAAIAGIGGKGEEKSVKIFVQQGVSADTFIQSRAQVERAMRR